LPLAFLQIVTAPLFRFQGASNRLFGYKFATENAKSEETLKEGLRARPSQQGWRACLNSVCVLAKRSI